MPVRKSNWRAPNAQASRTRVRQAKSRANTKARAHQRTRSKGERGEHRICARCRKRADKCTKGGCIPFEHTVVESEYTEFQTFLKESLGSFERPRRFDTDCIDVDIVGGFASQCHMKGRIKTGLFACVLAGHYGNNLESWSKLLEANTGDDMDWTLLEGKVLECQTLFRQDEEGERAPQLKLYVGMRLQAVAWGC